MPQTHLGLLSLTVQTSNRHSGIGRLNELSRGGTLVGGCWLQRPQRRGAGLMAHLEDGRTEVRLVVASSSANYKTTVQMRANKGPAESRTPAIRHEDPRSRVLAQAHKLVPEAI